MTTTPQQASLRTNWDTTSVPTTTAKRMLPSPPLVRQPTCSSWPQLYPHSVPALRTR
ncbi:hypothetical protein DPMN_179209 [Dreissena polymorpha]|uniref:Uncharacterized protein n=1 Tax=Dreissena polymorpha TaxID=45954 RepID=A0A9D4EFM6_DREPO|nr:hypothetical protein DPMN_179209 [Dreissena polymorpha]